MPGAQGSALARDLNGNRCSRRIPGCRAADARLDRVRRAARTEAFAPLYATLQRTALVLVAALLISIAASFFLARALVRPLRALQRGAEKIGTGDLAHHIVVRTGDELEGLAEQFNHMSEQLREFYAGLERKVAQRTQELSETLEHQIAISEIMRVINKSPSDVSPVLEAILDSATSLFGTPLGAIFRYDGELVHQVAVRNWSSEAIENARRLLSGAARHADADGRIILSGAVQVEEDSFADPATTRRRRTSVSGAAWSVRHC